jgi:mRNA interferase RelE/StbE
MCSDIFIDNIAKKSDIYFVKTIIFIPKAAKQLDNLPQDIRIAVEVSLDRYAITGIGDVKKLSGRNGYRMRVGDYRVIFDEDGLTIGSRQV